MQVRYLSFCIWLISLSATSSRFVRAGANGSLSFFAQAEYYSPVYTLPLLHPLIRGGTPRLLPIPVLANNAVMDTECTYLPETLFYSSVCLTGIFPLWAPSRTLYLVTPGSFFQIKTLPHNRLEPDHTARAALLVGLAGVQWGKGARWQIPPHLEARWGPAVTPPWVFFKGPTPSPRKEPAASPAGLR